ncbi:MAG: hypothetical protein EA402_03970 [Planctomycetota bacterium]|nr:MAG: hypothetical protein EA402_03970 [Planctomycetota bacterium]
MPASSLPVLPVFPDGSLPPLPLLRQWFREAAEAGEELGCERLPHGNGILPPLMQLAGMRRLRIFRPDLPRRFRWQNSDGSAEVVVDNRGVEEELAEDAALEVRRGHLPPCPGSEGSSGRVIDRVMRRVEAARLTDGAAILDDGIGADWRPALSALSYGGAPPPLRTQSIALEDGPMRVWNPLPFARRCVAALPPDGQAPPWSVIDHRGAKHPIQVVEGPVGEQWLTELQLGPLEVVDLVPYHDPVNAEHWEVSAKVIDNGVVRAELDDRGAIRRLCCDGRFINAAGPLAEPLVDGHALGGEVHIRPLERGPSRGRVLVTIDDEAGVLRLIYSVHAHDDILQVAVTWNPRRDCELVLRHPIPAGPATLTSCGDGAPDVLPLGNLSTSEAARPRGGLRWVRLERGEESMALVGQRPFTLIPADASIVVGDGCLYGLGWGRRSGEQLSLAEAALSLGVPGRHAGSAEVAAPAFHLGDHHQLTALWMAKPEDWALEVLLVEQNGVSGRAELYPHPQFEALNEARLVDADGRKLESLSLTKEGDGWIIPYQPHSISIVRLR